MSFQQDMIRSLTAFQQDVNEFVHTKLPHRVQLWQQRIYGELFKKLVIRTPVLTGNTRANWQVTRTKFSTRLFGVKVDSTGDETIQRGLDQIERIPAYANAYIINNVPWLELLEGGSSTQAPHGWIGITIASVNDRYFYAEPA
jgi:hypothetical protein